MKIILSIIIFTFVIFNNTICRDRYRSSNHEICFQTYGDLNFKNYKNPQLENTFFNSNDLELRLLFTGEIGSREDISNELYTSNMDLGISYSKSFDNRNADKITCLNSAFKMFYGFNLLSYNFLSTDIFFYVHNGIMWNYTTNIYPNDSTIDRKLMSDFSQETNFGLLNNNGIRAFWGQHISTSIEMERNLIYPSHLFLQANISSISSSLTDFLLSELVLKNFRKSSYLPILTLIFRGGLNYVFYELRSKKMNWPFESEPALLVTKCKFGLSYTF